MTARAEDYERRWNAPPPTPVPGRFFGWVMGGMLPAALPADWLTSAWDQNSGLRFADVGFVTGATMANFGSERRI